MSHTQGCIRGIYSVRMRLSNFVYAPRAGFFAVFTVLASGMSRFTSLFLRERFLDDAAVGVALGISSLSIVAVPLVTALADKFAHDRAIVLLVMTFVGTVLVLMQGLVDLGIVTASAAPVYLAINRLFISSSLAPQIPVLDALAVEGSLEVENYGHERLWGAVSWGIWHLLMGGLIDLTGGTFVIFYLAILSAIMYIPLLLVWRQKQMKEKNNKMDEKVKDEEEENTTTSTKTPTPRITHLLRQQVVFAFSKVHITCFLIDIFVLSAGTSVVEGLLFLFFTTSLKASCFLLGCTVVMTVLFEIPLFAMSDKIMKKFSTTQLMVVAHLAYGLRVFGYTWIPSEMPYLILLLEPLHGVTFALKQLVSVTVVARIAKPGFKNSAQGVVTTVVSLGGLTGSVVGGFVLKYQGPTVLYRGAGGLVLLAGALYVLSDKWCGRDGNDVSGQEIEKGACVEMREEDRNSVVDKVIEVAVDNEDVSEITEKKWKDMRTDT